LISVTIPANCIVTFLEGIQTTNKQD